MGQITLSPGRVVASRWYGEEDMVWPSSIQDLVPYFFDCLKLDPALTLGDLFQLLDRDDVELLAAVLNENVIPILEEGRRGGSEPNGEESLQFLRVYNRHEDGYLRRGLDAWGSWNQPYDDAEATAAPRATWFSVSLTPVGQLLDLPMRYDSALEFRDRAGATEYRTNVAITFLEFLKAIFDDLTFYGTPDERDAVLEDLRRQVEEIDRGEARLIPAEEVLRELRGDRDEK